MEKMKAITNRCQDLPVHFAGFVNQSRLPEIYAASDVLCLPSGGAETWGLVVNEAMHFGCIPVVSDHVGCGPDLVDGIGEIHHLGDVEGIADSIMKVFDNLEGRRISIPARIAQYSLALAVDGIVEGAMRAFNR
jgi:glycosyltransferase involved in cell wall biosynthesis